MCSNVKNESEREHKRQYLEISTSKKGTKKEIKCSKDVLIYIKTSYYFSCSYAWKVMFTFVDENQYF